AVERAAVGLFGGFHVVAAVAAVVGLAGNVTAGGAIGFAAQKPAVGVHHHAQRVGQLHPVVGIGVYGQIPVADLLRANAGQQGEIARHHQALNMVRVGVGEGGAEALTHAVHLGGAAPVIPRQRLFILLTVAAGVLRHKGPVNAAYILAPAN